MQPTPGMTHKKYAHDPQTYVIIGAGHEVVRNLGTGFSEALVCEALMIELGIRGIPFKTQVAFTVNYKGHRLSHYYRADLVCFDSVIVEVKTTARTAEQVEAQILNYLKASGLKCALLLDFSGSAMKSRRFVPNDKWTAAKIVDGDETRPEGEHLRLPDPT